MNLTNHANQRIQQRNVSPLVVRWLIEFGAHRHDKHGAVIRYFDKRARKALSKAVGKTVVDQLARQLNAYVVTSGDSVITTGYRTKRIIGR